MNWTEERLDQLLTTPSAGMIEDIAKIKGDIMILGAGGKMGPTLATLAKNAVKAAGIEKRIIAVSRFSDPFAVKLLHSNDVETISVDLLAEGAMEKLPDVENIIYMAGRKFGTGDDASPTWAMNTSLPTLVTRRFKGANFVVFSTGNVYPMTSISSGALFQARNNCVRKRKKPSSLKQENGLESGADSQRPFSKQKSRDSWGFRAPKIPADSHMIIF